MQITYLLHPIKVHDCYVYCMLCPIRSHVTLLTRYHQKRQELEKLRCDLADTEAKLATQEVLLNEVSELIETTGESIPSALEFSADISLEDTGSTVSYFKILYIFKNQTVEFLFSVCLSARYCSTAIFGTSLDSYLVTWNFKVNRFNTFIDQGH